VKNAGSTVVADGSTDAPPTSCDPAPEEGKDGEGGGAADPAGAIADGASDGVVPEGKTKKPDIRNSSQATSAMPVMLKKRNLDVQAVCMQVKRPTLVAFAAG
jgi:hypothetical protein